MKKLLSFIISALMICSILAGCGANADKEPATEPTNTGTDAPAPEAKKLDVVTTIFPEYDWVRQIAGDRADITMLLDNGIDLHSYQPTADDIIKISNCDMFIYVGGESDEWVEEVLDKARNKDMAVINLLEALGDSVKEEEVVEGMEAEHDHDHEHEEIEEEDIEDRSLAEFEGTWKSLYPLLSDGKLEEFLEHKAEDAEDDSVTVETLREKYTANWACDAVEISIAGDTITFKSADGKTSGGKYKYAGYSVIKDDDEDITGVKYQFESSDKGAPKFVQFNDHGHEPAEKVEHFHIYFGDDSFDTLLESKTNPFFVPEDLSVEEITEELTGGHDHDHGEEPEYDEHVWLSLKNASVLCRTIADRLETLDPDNKTLYKTNADAYIESLNKLDNEYKTAVKAGAVKTLLFGDRFPFRYLVDDYGLDYYAAFVGCSAETEASFETIAFLAKKVDELGLKAIMQIESADGTIANTVKSTAKTGAGVTVLTMDSMQSTTSKDIESGETYLGTMRNNLEILKSAIN